MIVGLAVLAEDARDAGTPSLDVLVSRIASFDRAARVATAHAERRPHLVAFGEFSFASKAACEDDFEYMKEFAVEVPPALVAPQDDLPRYPYLDSARTVIARSSSLVMSPLEEVSETTDALEEGTSPRPMRKVVVEEGFVHSDEENDSDDDSSDSSSSSVYEDYATAENCARSVPFDFDSPDRPRVLWRVLQSICVRNDVACLFNVAEWDFATNKLFNTSVVISRHGNMLAKYRKKNVFFKSIFETPSEREPATSTFRFGYKAGDGSVDTRLIGMMTCYDYLWSKPSKDLSKIKNLDFVLYTFMSGPARAAFSATLRSWCLYWGMPLVAIDGTGRTAQSGSFSRFGRRGAEIESLALGVGFDSEDRVFTIEV